MLVHDLISAEPNAIVMEFKGEHMVNKWFALWMILWSVKHLQQKLFHQTQVCRAIKRLVEREKRSTVLQAVASQLEFVARVDVRDEEFGGGADRALG